MTEKLDAVREALKSVIDPELGLNIVDLGLIYDLQIDEQNRAFVLMTFTTMGCPMGGTLVNGVYRALEPFDFADIKVDITFNPPWSPAKMSAEGRQRLGVR